MKYFIASVLAEHIEKIMKPILKWCGYHLEYEITENDTTQGSALFV
jgi:hypothetical protein